MDTTMDDETSRGDERHLRVASEPATTGVVARVLDAKDERIEELEEKFEKFRELVDVFEDRVMNVLYDRELMLEAMKLTEHEWACRGGERFEDLELPLAVLDAEERAEQKEAIAAAQATVFVPPPPPPPPEFQAADWPPPPPPPPPEFAAFPPPPPPPPVEVAPVVADEFSEVWSMVSTPKVRSFEWTDEQRTALDAIEDWKQNRGHENHFALTGAAGTGKSTMMREIATRYPMSTLTAMTGRAALRLSECAGAPASTLHKVLYWPPKPGEEVRFSRLREPTSSLVCVDESSMMTPSIFADCKRWAKMYGVRFLLVGDAYQLPPVITEKSEREQYGEDYSVFTHVAGAALQTVMRNAGGVLRAATHVRQTGHICAESMLDAAGGVGGYEFIRETQPLKRAVEDYLADRDDHFLITWRNSSRMEANGIIRERLGHAGPLPDEGEPVLLRKNGQGLLNGEIVECGGFEPAPDVGEVKCLWMLVRGYPGVERVLISFQGKEQPFDGQMPEISNWRGYHIAIKNGILPEPLPATFGYCLTCHAAQGGQARRTTIFLERSDYSNSHFKKPTTLPNGEKTSFAARWAYTAMTRSTSRTSMIVGR